MYLRAGKAGGNGGAAILDALRTGLRFQPIMCQTFFREIKEVGAPGHEHRMLDVWVLLVVHAMGGAQKKAVEATLTKKVAAGHVTIRLLKGSVLVRRIKTVHARATSMHSAGVVPV